MIRLSSQLAFGAIAIMLPFAAQAGTTRLGVDVSTTLGYGSNPFSITSGKTGSGSAQVEIRPEFKLLSERSQLTVSGSANVQQYFRRYSRADNYEARVDYRIRPSERLTTHFNLAYQNGILGSYNDFSGRPLDPLPEAGGGSPVIPGTDIGLFGTRSRRQTYTAGGDVALVLSDRDQIIGTAFYLDSAYSQVGGLNNYRGYGGSVGYSRQLSQYTQLGLQVSNAQYDYDLAGNDSNIVALQGTFSTQFSSSWTASGALGASFINRTGAGSKTAFSGNLSICHKDARSTACLTARRSVLPTGTFGTQIETGGGASYRYRLSERGNLGLSADYTKNESGLVALTRGNQYLRTSVSYDHQIKERVRLIASAYYRDIFGGTFGTKADFGGQVGVAVRLGDVK